MPLSSCARAFSCRCDNEGVESTKYCWASPRLGYGNTISSDMMLVVVVAVDVDALEVTVGTRRSGRIEIGLHLTARDASASHEIRTRHRRASCLSARNLPTPRPLSSTPSAPSYSSSNTSGLSCHPLRLSSRKQLPCARQIQAKRRRFTRRS